MSLSEKLWNAEADHVIEERDELEAEVMRLRQQRDELLAACKALLAAGESGEIVDWYHAREQARAVIARATGANEEGFVDFPEPDQTYGADSGED